MARRSLLLAALVLLLPSAGAAEPVPAPKPPVPLRAAFYYPWYPAAWHQRGMPHYSRYAPSLGFYSSSNPAVIRAHVRAMLYGGIHAGIVSWWGRGHRTDRRLPQLLRVSAALTKRFWWTIYYEPEGQGDPSVARIRSDLRYLRDRYAHRSDFLHVGRRFVVFVYADANDGCGTAARWRAANTVGAYLVLKVFPGFRSCPAQPNAWHQYAPSTATQDYAPWSFSISPGFAKADESLDRLARDPQRWQASVRQMVASHARFQLVTTFNEWGEGTAVESARQWSSPSGYGTYLDALHANGGVVPPGPPPASGPDPVVVAVGDIACDPSDRGFNGGNGTSNTCRQRVTSDLALALHPTAVLTLGDTQYEDNAYAKYLLSFGPSWGRLKTLIHPAIGNHEYLTANAAGYFQYFGAAAGDPSRGLLQLRPRNVAPARAQLRVLARRRLRAGLAAGVVAALRPRRAPEHVRARVLARAALLLRRARRRTADGDDLERPGRRARRRRPFRAQPRLRTVRAARRDARLLRSGAESRPRPARDPRVRRRHRWQESLPLRARPARRRDGAERRHVRRAAADTAPALVRLALRARAGTRVRGCWNDELLLRFPIK